MCFSASASFTAAGVLGYIGFLTNAQIRDNKYRMLAAVPLLFAVQQIAEGVVWLTMGKAEYQQIYKGAIYTFLSFALIVWPLWIPLSFWIAERNQNRKKWLMVLSSIGLLISCYTAFILFKFPVKAEVFNCSIWYSIGIASFVHRTVDILIYTVATIVPFFISSLPYASFLGGAIAVSLFFTYIWMHTTLISVWCFFAALLSVFTYLILRVQSDSKH